MCTQSRLVTWWDRYIRESFIYWYFVFFLLGYLWWSYLSYSLLQSYSLSHHDTELFIINILIITQLLLFLPSFSVIIDYAWYWLFIIASVFLFNLCQKIVLMSYQNLCHLKYKIIHYFTLSFRYSDQTFSNNRIPKVIFDLKDEGDPVAHHHTTSFLKCISWYTISLRITRLGFEISLICPYVIE